MTDRETTRQRLRDVDWIFIAVCAAVVLASVALIVRYFDSAFPQAAVEFKVDRNTSRPVAERFLTTHAIDVRAMKHAARFDSDDTARIFLERTVGLEQSNRILSTDVHVWTWHHRWFRPLVEEELSVDVTPSGEIVGFSHHVPEDRAIPDAGAAAEAQATAFLASAGIDLTDLVAVDRSERKLPRRVQRIFTWESRSVRPAGAPYRHTVTLDGNLVTGYTQSLKVPETWVRSYRELRSRNSAAGSIDIIFNIALMLGAVVIFVVRMRRGDLPLRFLIGVGIASVILVGGVALNSIPAQLAWYDTTTSYPAFLGTLAFQAAIQSIGTAMLLIVVCAAGESLYRERLPKQLAIPKVWTRRSLTSKRVFLSMILGYALVPAFIAYQVVFYVVSNRFGAWAPAEVPYDDMLNSALPWVAVLFAGFFPAFSEEFLSRAFSIPFVQRFVRWRFAAIVISAFIWGFGHSTYPNQPFWIRGVEVGIAGIAAGLIMDRYGLMPLLIWHYTIDAVYTATLLFGSGNTYYIVSAAFSSLLFAIPLVLSIVSYVRNRGFIPDDDLTNAAMPVSPPLEHSEVVVARAELPPAPALTRTRVVLCVALVAAAAVAIAMRPVSPSDAIDYRITSDRAKEIARSFLGPHGETFAYVIATPAEGFRSWDAGSSREDGGSPAGFDDTAATWLVRHGVSARALRDIFRSRLEAGTWTVRFFTPMQKEEIFVEIGRDGRILGYHKYQDEAAARPSLPEPLARALAQRSFSRFGVDPRSFAVKEALTFQQPRRRDWLFHFEENTPVAVATPSAFRRVTVRVAGNEVTQFHKTIKVPDSVYREASTQTLLNVVLFVLKIAGVVTLLALVIAGIVVATRAHGLPWRRALRWTLYLAVIPIAGFATRIESMLFGYSTSTAWETFRVNLVTAFVRDVGLQLGLMFVALAALEAALPYATDVLTRQGRAKYGRAAAVATITALSIVSIAQIASLAAAHAFPAAASVAVSAPLDVAIPLPALVNAAQAAFGAVIFSAAIALYGLSLHKHMALVTMAAIFCATLDPLASTAEVPVMLGRAVVLAVVVWLVATRVLDGNPLAWPLTVFTGSTLMTAAALLQNHRPDLVANAVALIVFALAALAFAMARPRDEERMLPRE